ncbi:unnamed protein product, partial [Mycena citricolor]
PQIRCKESERLDHEDEDSKQHTPEQLTVARGKLHKIDVQPVQGTRLMVYAPRERVGQHSPQARPPKQQGSLSLPEPES